MIDLITSTDKKAEWNTNAVHPMQSWEWGDARSEMGISVVRIAEVENDLLKTVYQMTLHPIPHTKYCIGYIPRSSMPSDEVISYLKEYGTKHNIVYIKFEPNDEGTEISIPQSLLKSTTPLFPAWTQTIDLTQSESELLKNLKSKTRYNIKLAQKKGVTIKEMTSDEGFEIFYKLYEDTCKRQHYFGHDYAYHKTVFNTLKGSISHILIAWYMDKPLAAYHLFLFNDVLYYPYGASSVENKEVMAPNLIMWEAIMLGKKLDAKLFDLWGSLPPEFDAKNMWAGFTRFKEGYGTQFVHKVGSYDLVVTPLLYYPLIAAQKVREKVLSL